jgi:hypothetical protein
MTKQITIYDLLPLLKPGWVAMDKSGFWWWYEFMPTRNDYCWLEEEVGNSIHINRIFDIAPFDGDWKSSLIKVGGKR